MLVQEPGTAVSTKAALRVMEGSGPQGDVLHTVPQEADV